MKPASAKQKGRILCQRAKKIILNYFPRFEDGDIVVRSSGSNGEDLILSPAVLKVLPFAIEAKNQEKINIWQSYEQAEAHSKKGDLMPLVIFGKNRRDPLVCLDLEHFLDLIKRKETNVDPPFAGIHLP
jgi:hypothetical protein